MASIQRLVRLGAALAFNPMTIVEDAAAAAPPTAVLIICILVAGVIVLPAVGCLAAALWIFVQHRLGPVWAAVITAAALILLAIIVLLVGVMQSKKRPVDQERRTRRSSTPASLAAAGLSALPPPDELIAQGRRAFRQNKGTILLAAGVAGLLFGQNLLRPRPRYVVRPETPAGRGWRSMFRRS
jgi:hypothetical protein